MDRRRAVYMSVPSRSGQENLPPMRSATVKTVNRSQLTPQQIRQLELQKQRIQMQLEQKQKDQQMKARLRQIQEHNRQEQRKQEIARQQAEKVPDDPILREELLKKLKDQYLEVLENLEMPEQSIGGLKGAMEVLKGERETSYGRLLNIEMGLQKILVRLCPTFEMMEECRKAMRKREVRLEEEPAEKERPKERLGVETWGSVKHLEIRVPEALRQLLQKPISCRHEML